MCSGIHSSLSSVEINIFKFERRVYVKFFFADVMVHRSCDIGVTQYIMKAHSLRHQLVSQKSETVRKILSRFDVLSISHKKKNIAVFFVCLTKAYTSCLLEVS